MGFGENINLFGFAVFLKQRSPHGIQFKQKLTMVAVVHQAKTRIFWASSRSRGWG